MKFSDLWKRLREKSYRESLVESYLKRSLSFQVRTMLKVRGWSQATLAEKSGLTQGVVSRVADPTYGNMTLNTLIRVAAGFDVAFVGKFVPFSELAQSYSDLSEEVGRVEAFDQEDAKTATVSLDHAAKYLAAQNTLAAMIYTTKQAPAPLLSEKLSLMESKATTQKWGYYGIKAPIYLVLPTADADSAVAKNDALMSIPEQTRMPKELMELSYGH